MENLLGFLIVAALAAVWTFLVWRDQKSTSWHVYGHDKMRRRKPDGTYEFRPMTEQEKMDDYDARQF